MCPLSDFRFLRPFPRFPNLDEIEDVVGVLYADEEPDCPVISFPYVAYGLLGFRSIADMPDLVGRILREILLGSGDRLLLGLEILPGLVDVASHSESLLAFRASLISASNLFCSSSAWDMLIIARIPSNSIAVNGAGILISP